MENMNHCILIGNLTKDPELKTTPSGVSVCAFSIAVNRPHKGADGNREVDFLNIITWRGLAENCAKYLAKGKKVAVTGEIQNRSYEDKDGNKRYTTEIIASSVDFLSTEQQESEQPTRPPKKEDDSYQTQLRGLAKKPELIPIEDDDSLPF
jgi:single-strand DNA-binding protein